MVEKENIEKEGVVVVRKALDKRDTRDISSLSNTTEEPISWFSKTSVSINQLVSHFDY